jgi:hypothetical protein
VAYPETMKASAGRVSFMMTDGEVLEGWKRSEAVEGVQW